MEARPPILGGERKRKGKDKDAVFVLAVACYLLLLVSCDKVAIDWVG